MRKGCTIFRRTCNRTSHVSRGATLLDVVVGSALMMMVFVGIFGAFKLSVEVVSNNKARAGAIALATEQIEYVRSLPYDAVGTVGGIPAGAILASATTTLNDVPYTRRTFISFEDDPGDGIGGADTNGIVVDYRAVKVSVSWNSKQGTRTLSMTTRFSPPTGMEVNVPGGTLSIFAVNAASQPIQNAQVRVINAAVVPPIDLTTFTDSAGTATILGAPPGGGYSVEVTKAGLSTARTYGATATNTNPMPAHLGVGLYQTTLGTFEIDVLSTLTVQTFEMIKERVWSDTFVDGSNVVSTTFVAISGGAAHLLQSAGSYAGTGSLISIAPSIPYLSRWKEASFIDLKPLGTTIVYRLYDSSSVALPESVLPGNSAGFTVSPVNISSVSTSTYALLRLGATLSTADPNLTPEIQSWNLTYDEGPIPLPNIVFTMRGAKTIGTAANGSLIYKYNNMTLNSGPTGGVQIGSLEWDSYTMTASSTSGYDIASSCGTLPVLVSPNTSVTTRLYLTPQTTNSLLVDVRSSSGLAIKDASVRLYRTGVNTTVVSDACGNSFFSGLSAGSVGTSNAYSLDVSATGYTSFTATDVNVSGTSRMSIILN